MRRLLTALMILLVVLVAGLSALVIMVDPNNFRSYIVREVEERSGYQLKLDGSLRWSVWPQLSILSGHMSLTAPGASKALVRSDNMRLDVALWPLLSHQLKVEQVMLKGAIIQLIPESEAKHPENAPVGPRGDESDVPVDTGDRWSWDISNLRVVDSLLVFEQDSKEQIVFRNINLDMTQDDKHQGTLELSGRINRDQRDLTLSLNAAIDASDYPQNLTATVSQFQWKLQGAGVPQNGVSGQGALQALWQKSAKKIAFSHLDLTANDSSFNGSVSLDYRDMPRWDLDLQFDKLNLEDLLVRDTSTNVTATQQGQQAQSVRQRPVVSVDEASEVGQVLRGFNADVRLKANSLRWRGLDFSNVNAALKNDAGLLDVTTLDGNLEQGRLSLPGRFDARTATPKTAFQPVIENIEIGSILHAFDYPIPLTGSFSMQGEFSGNHIDADAFRKEWQGKASVSMKNSRMEGLNFQQLIQQTLARDGQDMSSQQNYDNATTLASFTARARLDRGQLQLDEMAGESTVLALNGSGSLDLVKELCDTSFNVRVLKGWQGNSEVVTRLQNIAVPLRVYGSWQQLRYSVDADRALRKQLQDEARRRLNEWAERHKEKDAKKDR